MTKTIQPKAENRSAASEKRQMAILIENEKAAKAFREKTAKLKAQRLLRDAEDLQV